jgi:hypothetical protein
LVVFYQDDLFPGDGWMTKQGGASAALQYQKRM